MATSSTTDQACVHPTCEVSSVHSRQKTIAKVQPLKGKTGFVPGTLPKPADK